MRFAGSGLVEELVGRLGSLGKGSLDVVEVLLGLRDAVGRWRAYLVREKQSVEVHPDRSH